MLVDTTGWVDYQDVSFLDSVTYLGELIKLTHFHFRFNQGL